MIDVHTHTVLSDGALVPAEYLRRAEEKGYKGLALTDHVDNGTLEVVVPILVRACGELSEATKVKLVPGAEITHCRLEHIERLVADARGLGAKIVIIHGETIVEPVLPGSNRAAITAGADILAHPGLITLADARLAAKHDVYLEISARKGHCLANGHVYEVGRRAGAKFTFGSDAHDPGEIPTQDFAEKVLAGAGMTKREIRGVFRNMAKLVGL